jgi:putative CocE/NonD family hydrolase
MNRLPKFLSVILLLSSLIYLLRRHLYALVLRLSPPRNHVRVERGLTMATRDGVTLVGDIYLPTLPGKHPTILMRTPYGRSGRYSTFGHLQAFFAQRFAERGYAVLVQDVRGRFDSGGTFNPYLSESEDGLDTLEWLAQQPWCNGDLAMWGASYSGIVQWAVAPSTDRLKAFVPSITSSSLHSILYPDGAFDLGLALRWLSIFRTIDRNRRAPWANLWLFHEIEQMVKPAVAHLPLAETDRVALKSQVDFFRMWLEHPDKNDEMWTKIVEQLRAERVTAPAHLIGGWYDFFLRGMLRDYAKLKAAGQTPYLTIGPWHHFSALFSFADVREGLRWFDAHLKGETNGLRENPVRVYVMGKNEWCDLPDWTPPAAVRPFYLGASQSLTTGAPVGSAPPYRYTYDPNDPTPSVGGSQFSLSAGAVDNRRWERRKDVLTFTTVPLEQDLEVIGEVRLVLYVTSSLDYTDFFGRLCDVAPSGRSTNVCDGLFRVSPGLGECQPDGTLRIEVDMWATAYCFRKGHRVRLCVASGAHPRWNRNSGTGEPFNTCTNLRVAQQAIYCDAKHPSALLLPVVSEEQSESPARQEKIAEPQRHEAHKEVM